MIWGREARHRRIARGFARRGPWFTRFSIDGVDYGGETSFADEYRIRDFERTFPDTDHILELGSLEGGHTFELIKRPGRSVVAVEGRADNVERARYARRCLRATEVRFVHANLETTPLRRFGRFDVVYCSGLLYHLPDPAALLDQFAAVAPATFVATHYARDDEVDAVLHGMPGRWYSELGLGDPLSGMSARSFWPARDALLDRIRSAGFVRVEVLHDAPEHPNGAHISLAAWTDGGLPTPA